jgi:hypothetical protein
MPAEVNPLRPSKEPSAMIGIKASARGRIVTRGGEKYRQESLDGWTDGMILSSDIRRW